MYIYTFHLLEARNTSAKESLSNEQKKPYELKGYEQKCPSLFTFWGVPFICAQGQLNFLHATQHCKQN